jgi:hypothetical protein
MLLARRSRCPISDDITFFNLHLPPSRTIALRLTQLLIKMSVKDFAG